jgi:voltage-dependent anion channel protein 2
MNTTTDLTSTHLVELATTVGTSELVIGAEVGFDITSDAVTKYNSGAGYNKFDFSASLLM